MGLFQHKQSKKNAPANDTEAVERFFDETFREELRNHGRWYFEKVITENAALFKQELDATITQISAELRQHLSEQLDKQLADNTKAISEAQEAALQSLRDSAEASREQQEQLSSTLQKSIGDQEATLAKVMNDAQETALKALNASAQAFEQQQQQLNDTLQKNIASEEAALMGELDETKTRIAAIKDAQDAALQSLSASAQALEQQQEQLGALVQKNVAAEEALLVKVFEDNMSQIIEHYLLTVLGEQFDLKAQLPAIIKQMEASKQAIVDDMKL